MSESSAHNDYLVLSRGHWDPDAPKEAIETAIGQFYEWLFDNIEKGHMRMGSRLSTEGARVSKTGITLDGPFGEAKEVIGGYWIVIAPDLRTAAELASRNPCIPFGLTFEIRPLEAIRASVYAVTNETAPASA